METEAKKFVVLDEKTILWIYHMVDRALKHANPTVKNVYDIWVRRKEAKGFETVQCEREEIIKIANVLRDNRLQIEATFMNGVKGLDKEELIRRAVILHKRYDYSPGDISRALDIPPDSASNIVEKHVTRPRNRIKHLKLVAEREIEALKNAPQAGKIKNKR